MQLQEEFRTFMTNELQITSTSDYISRLKFLEKQGIIDEIGPDNLNSYDQLQSMLTALNNPLRYSDIHAAGKAYLRFLNAYHSIFEDDNKENLDPNSRQATRNGQFKWRQLLIERFRKCVVTQTSSTFVLIASHIKPYRVCKEQEKFDPDNGLLLLASVDKLFDQGLISFDNEGNVMRSSWISEYERLNIMHQSNGLKFKLNEKQKEYFMYHRMNVFIP